MGRRRVAPRPLSAVLSEALGRAAAGQPVVAVEQAWREVAREVPAAAGCMPLKLEEGQLTVAVPDALVREELSYQLEEVVERLNGLLRGSAVITVRLVLKGS
jgi:hypothetical protein